MSIFKKSVVLLVIFSLLGFVTVNPTLNAAGVIPVKQLAEVEKLLYGKAENGSLIKRIEGLEKTLYDTKKKGTLVERANRIIDDVLQNKKNPSLILTINCLEWSLTNQIGDKDVLTRLENLENVVFGNSRSGAVIKRINKLVKMGLPKNEVPVEEVKIPANTLIKVKLLNKISSVSSQTGEVINFEIAKNVKIDNKLVLPEGLRGSMKITAIDQAGQMGQDGEVKLDFAPLRSIDGSLLSLEISKKAQEENRSQQLAIGASILGTVILGPVGLITGYFVKGNAEEIPAGSEIYVQTTTDRAVYGLKLN